MRSSAEGGGGGGSAAPSGSLSGRLGLRIELADQAATEALAAALAGLAGAGDVLALRGDLGAGKTVFARAFIRARGRSDEEVPSPTFTLVQTYEPSGEVPGGADAAVWHFDLYRLDDAREAFELGIEDAFTAGIALIEWPDRLGPLLPERRLAVTLAPGPSPDSRIAIIDGDATWRRRLSGAGFA